MFDWLDEGLSLESLRRRLVIHPYFCISIFASTLPNILELFHRGPRNSRKLVRNFVRKLFFLCARAIDNYFEIVYSNITSRCWSDTENLVVTFACTLGLFEIQIVILYRTLYFLFFKGTVPYTVTNSIKTWKSDPMKSPSHATSKSYQICFLFYGAWPCLYLKAGAQGR